MPKSNNRKNTKLHCQHCAKPRLMQSFWAIEPAAKVEGGKPLAIPFNYKKFKDLIQGKAMVKLPPFYAGICTVCNQTTYFVANNRKNTIRMIPDRLAKAVTASINVPEPETPKEEVVPVTE